ncbi:hypothetical protein [Mucilaginibacter sp.]
MIKFTKLFITFLLALTVFQVSAQSTASTSTTSSPYSQFGIGTLDQMALPQTIGMGGLGAAINNFSGYYNLNPVNPASYGSLRLTVIDIGLYGNTTNLSQSGQPSQSNGSFRLNHVAFAFPISKKSALSFGLQPYSSMGYNYTTTKKNLGSGNVADTNAVNYLYSGQGDLSKAYIGYGFGIGKHLLLGVNASYIFGNLHQYSSTEIPSLFSTVDSRVEDDYAIGGASYDIGGQYTIDFSDSKHLILGYSATLSSNIGSQHTNIVSQYSYDDSGNENPASDTLSETKDPKSKLHLPYIGRYGATFVSDNKFLIGAEYSQGNWSQLSIPGITGQEYQNSKTYNLGGQFTPNANALSNYWATIDYRLGVIYNQTYMDVQTGNSSTNITDKAITFGLGLPLRPGNGSYYKINFAAEIGTRGTEANGLVKENYVNFHLSFSLNDKWFTKYKLD